MRSISELIRNISGSGSAAHAYIIEGRHEASRRSFIETLTAGLCCLEPDPAARPCGCCDACRQIKAGTSLDVVHMSMSGKSSYKTEDAADFIERLDMEAYGRFLIGIIDDADCLSETVQNKLLKTLEEPRASVIMMLGTSNTDLLLRTVRSRCISLRVQDYEGFADPDEQEIQEAIEHAAAVMTGGGAAFYEFRDALSKCVKTKADALSLIGSAEDGLRALMISGTDPVGAAQRIELCERARMDIERDMDKIKALKRLYLSLRA